VEAIAAFVAWAGAAAIVLADARRGLAAGIALVGIGLAVASLPRAGWAGAALIAAGAAAAAARRYVVGPAGWRVMPPGSTPRLVLSVAGGIVALWIAVAVMSGPSGALRFGSLAVLALSGGRLLSSDDPCVAQTAVAAVALAVAAAAGLASGPTAVWPYLAGAAVAAAAVWVPYRARRAA
jgi:hypothetical protein